MNLIKSAFNLESYSNFWKSTIYWILYFWLAWPKGSIGCVALPWHFEFYILKFQNVKFFFINFLDELGNLKQKNFYASKCKIFLHFIAYHTLCEQNQENISPIYI